MSRDQNRERMPTVAALVDRFRPWMGRVIYASENGHVIDRREPEPNVYQLEPERFRIAQPKKGRK